MVTTLLAIDDDEANCRLVRATFNAEGLEVLTAHDGPAGLDLIQRHEPDIVLLDVRLPSKSGLEVLEEIRASRPSLPVVMLTASRDVRTAVRATQLGAVDYLTKPIDPDEIVSVVDRALEARALRLEVEDLRRRVSRSESDQLLFEMGSSTQVEELLEQVRLVAASNFTVLITGETGSGKELVARAIHRLSPRRTHPFIALDCGAIPEPLLESELFGHERGAFTGADHRRRGHFQLAAGGTCLLDEVGNLPVSLQAKLLRVLESKQVQPVGAERATPVDVRFIAASNEDLASRAQDGRFRADLYFRLAQYTIALPPLRKRPEDIAYLAQRFLEEVRVELRRPVQQLTPAAIELLQHAAWPGNVRELRNVVRQAVLRSRGLEVHSGDLQMLLSAPSPRRMPESMASSGRSLREIAESASSSAERAAICDTLRATRGNKSQAARALQVDYKTLHLKMKRLGIPSRDFVP